MSFGDWLPKQAPPPLAGPNGSVFFQREGEMFDEQRDRLLQGVLARFPTQGSVDANGVYGTPPSDALDAMGQDRGLPRGPAEVIAGGDSAGTIAAKDLAYATRLQAAWTTWDYAGAHYGILRALEIAGFVSPHGIIVQDNGRWSQITGSAGNIADWTFGALQTCINRGGIPGWTFDNQTDFYARFALIYTSMPSLLNTAAGQTLHNQLINAWRPANKIFFGTYVIASDGIWGFGASPPALGTWGTGNWGGSTYTWTNGSDSLPYIPPNV